MAQVRDEAKAVRTPLLSLATAGGEGEGSYTSESKKFNVIQSLLKPVLKDTLLHHFSPVVGAGPFHYADFGCSVGNNTIDFATFVTDILKSKPELNGNDFVCHFADLPSNDFNTLFKQLAGEERTWFAEGVAGSQYSRMFPRSSLHVAITTLTLHYMSEVWLFVTECAMIIILAAFGFDFLVLKH